jgi:UDP-GlcNAc:undecaprenyl-phosphate/decaprenyl-phosphate GlcNAc-1-phosphate transferase
MLSICLSLALVSLAIGWPAARLARAIGRDMNAYDGAGVSGQVKSAPRRVPNLGGIGIFVAVVAPLLVVLLLARMSQLPSGENWFARRGIFPEVAVHWQGIQQQTPAALILLGALLVLHVLGIIDDRKPLGPGVKLPFMLAAAITVVIGTDSRLLTLMDGFGFAGHIASVALTVLWILVITNAFNFLDNMDGLSGGIAAICSAAFLTTALVSQQWFIAAILALLLGALLGFLRYNFPFTKSGATLFMGDSGSLIVGFLLAVMSVRITYLPHSSDLSTSSLGHFVTSFPPLLAPLIILAIPLYDFCSVVLIRLRQGRSPFVGDLQHFSHRLVKHGLSRSSAVLVICGCTAVTGIGAIALPKLEPWQAVLVGVQTLLVLLVIALYEWTRTPSTDLAASGKGATL